MILKQIGIIHSPFRQARGTPIQPAFAEGVRGEVHVKAEYAEGLLDLEGSERIGLVYWFDRAGAPRMRLTPFRDTAQHGVFATRAPCHPNPIGLSAVKLLEVDGRVLHISELNVLDGTPLLDVKPYAGQVPSPQRPQFVPGRHL